ncbi:hypothetical protein FHX15_005302 [Rhizobium sp. BK650]|nr:hypothetical protein [Rhizobium sp. BK650]
MRQGLLKASLVVDESDYDSAQAFKENVLKVHLVSNTGLLKVEKHR